MSTTETTTTLKAALDKAQQGDLGPLLALLKLGTMMTLVSETIALAAVSATVNVATLSVAKLPIHSILSLRVSDVTGGTEARVGSFIVTDASGTALAAQADSPGIAKLSADGTTLTFVGTVKEIVIQYYPRPFTALTTRFPPLT